MKLQNNLVTTIPEGIPTPRFELFQPVRRGQRKGYVVGMKWLCPIDAVVLGLKSYGWVYDISFLYGKSAEAAFNAPDFGYEIPEDCIQPVAEGVAT